MNARTKNKEKQMTLDEENSFMKIELQEVKDLNKELNAKWRSLQKEVGEEATDLKTKIVNEAIKIATNETGSCFTLVELTRELIKANRAEE